jgi:hypothetical protein
MYDLLLLRLAQKTGSEFSTGGSSILLVFVKCKMIVLNGFIIISSFVLTSSSGIGSVNMVGVKGEYCREVLY